jgi:rubrerythrin
MTDREKELFAIFKQAIEAEKGAQTMYQKALDLADDPLLKQALQGFRDDEVRHEAEILRRYRQFREEFGAE